VTGLDSPTVASPVPIRERVDEPEDAVEPPMGEGDAWLAVAEMADSALAYLSLEELLGQLLERIRTLVRADTAAILLLDRDRRVLLARAAKGVEEEVRQGVSIPLGAGFAGRIAAEGRAVAIEDVDHADILNPILREKGIRSLLGVPLVVDGRVMGVLHVGTHRRRVFTEHDRQLLQMAANRAALAIDNAQLSEQRAFLEVLQHQLLVERLPQIPGLRISAKYVPAAGALVGGDWYDVFHLPDGRIALVVGDVAGRGLPAAAVMTQVRTALRAYLLERRELDHVLALLNQLILSTGRRRGVSVAIHTLDLESRELVAINAGQPPALMIAADGSQHLVAHASGPPLGSRLSAGYEAQTLEYPSPSALIVYTDGLIERRGESLDGGLARLEHADLAGGAAGLPLAHRTFNRIARDVSLEDDVAVLAIEAFPLGAGFDMTLEADPVVLASLRRVVARWLIELGVPDAQRFDLTLACSEAATNAIEHAYGPRDASFRVHGEASDERIVLHIADYGSWRARAGRDRGRGLMLMRALVDDVLIDRSPAGTTITLVARRQ
jgi:anti-sigma regulatory factor (Ser/Thr protein kinase)